MRIDSDPGETGIRAVDLEVSYAAFPVLRGVNICVGRGESVAVVGPNGAGKSTLLNSLAGILSPSRGTIDIDGRLISSCSRKEIARMVAVVPQKLDIGFGLSVQQVVTLGRTPHIGVLGSGGPNDRDAVTRAMEETEILHLSRRRYSTLSGGEQQRAVLAMALAQETPFLLLDEPTVHLDLGQQWRFMERLSRLRSSRCVGVLAIVHDLTLAGIYFDQVVLLHRGRVVAAGPAPDVLTREAVSSVFGAPIAVSRRYGSVSVVLDRPGEEDVLESTVFGDLPVADLVKEGHLRD
jgi:iron complex transport system ATP-binding protein